MSVNGVIYVCRMKRRRSLANDYLMGSNINASIGKTKESVRAEGVIEIGFSYGCAAGVRKNITWCGI